MLSIPRAKGDLKIVTDIFQKPPPFYLRGFMFEKHPPLPKKAPPVIPQTELLL